MSTNTNSTNVDNPEPGILKVKYQLPTWPCLHPYRNYQAAFIEGFDYGCDTMINLFQIPNLGYAPEMVDDLSATVNAYKRHMVQDHFTNTKYLNELFTPDNQRCTHTWKVDFTVQVFKYPCYKGFHDGAVTAIRDINFGKRIPEYVEDKDEFLKGLEAGVRHEFVRLMELDGQTARKKSESSLEKQRRQEEFQGVGPMLCRMWFERLRGGLAEYCEWKRHQWLEST
jgi:hypothetical protein